MDAQLEPPALNIEASSILPICDKEPALYGWDWIDPRIENGSSQPFKDASRQAWADLNKTYWLADIINGGSCAPETDVSYIIPLTLNQHILC